MKNDIDWKSIESISENILKLVPQQYPFRFIDKILEVDDERIVGQYTYKKDEYFYQGHFPDKPVTPGVIQIETMAQTAVVAFGLYLFLKNSTNNENSEKLLTLFTDVEAEFLKGIEPGTTVTIKAEKVYWRKNKLKSKAAIYLPNGDLAATATLSGIGVKQ